MKNKEYLGPLLSFIFGVLCISWIIYGMFKTPPMYNILIGVFLIISIGFSSLYGSYRMYKNMKEEIENDLLSNMTEEERINYHRYKILKKII